MSTAPERGDGTLNRRKCGDHDEQSFWAKLERAVEDGDPIGARQLNVAEDDLRLEGFYLGESGGKVCGRGGLEALALEEFPEGGGNDFLVIHDEDAAARGRIVGFL